MPRFASVHSRNINISQLTGAIPEGTIDSELFGHLKEHLPGQQSQKGYLRRLMGNYFFR